MEAPASTSLVSSFTNHLIDILKAKKDVGVTIAEINAMMMQNALKSDLTPLPGMVLPQIKTPSHYEARFRSRSPTIAPRYQVPTEKFSSRSLAGVATIPSINEFVRWLTTNAPETVSGIKVEAAFPTTSSCVLLSMPTEVWSCLENSKAFCFVSHIFGPNVLQVPRLSTGPMVGSSGRPAGRGDSGSAFEQTGLPFRGDENKPFRGVEQKG
jgi:hypothetical protein